MLPGTIAPSSYMPTRIKKELDWPLPIQHGAKQMKARRVQEWLTIGGFPVVIDSDFGSATEQRVRDFQTAKGLGTTGIVDAATHEQLVAPLVNALVPIAPGGMTLSALILAYSLQHVAQHPVEAGGDNCGPWVRAYMGNDGVDWKWCSGFVCFSLEQAAKSLGIPAPIGSSASCDVMKSNAHAAGIYRSGGAVGPAAIPPGSFFLVRRTSTDWTHIGIVSQANASSFRTVEGNTNDGGSVNGFEACQRVRDYNRKDFIIW